MMLGHKWHILYNKHINIKISLVQTIWRELCKFNKLKGIQIAFFFMYKIMVRNLKKAIYKLIVGQLLHNYLQFHYQINLYKKNQLGFLDTSIDDLL